MAEAPGTVFHGRVGTGAAQVLGAPGDPVGAYRGHLHRQEAMRIMGERQKVEQKRNREQAFKEILAEDPEATWQPFNQQVVDAYESKIRQPTINAYESGIDPNSFAFRTRLDKAFDEVNAIARKGNYIKETVNAALKNLKDNDLLDFDYYLEKINDVYLNPDGSAKPYEDINADDIAQLMLNDTGGFKIGDYANNFMDNLSANVIEYKRERNNAMGVKTDIEKIKSLLYVPEEGSENGVKMGPDGRPEINVTDEVVEGFKADRFARRFIQEEAKRTGESERNVIAKYVAPHAFVEKTLRSNIVKANVGSGGSGDGELVPFMNRRVEQLNEIKNAFYDQQGNRLEQPTENAQKVLGSLIGSTFAGDRIDAARLVRGTDEDPRDRIELDLIIGSRVGGRDTKETKVIDLTDPKAAAEINGILNDAITEGEKKFRSFSWANQLEPFIAANPGSFVARGGEGPAVDNEQIQKWQAGEELGKLKGKTFKGKVIKDAKWNDGGNEAFVDILFEDGSAENVQSSDYESFVEMVSLSAYPQDIQSAITAFANANNLTETEAIQILKDNGRLE